MRTWRRHAPASALLEQQAGKEADDRAWADAARTGTAGAFNAYVRRFGNGAHVAEARTRLTQLDERARKEADEKAWAEATRAGTVVALTGYIRDFGSGAHVIEARARLAQLEEQARKEADEKAWAEAMRAGTTAAFNGYIQKFPSGAHVAEARTRLAALEAKARKDADAMRGALAAIPTVDIRKTCATAAGVAGAKPTEESMSGCLQSEQAAREFDRQAMGAVHVRRPIPLHHHQGLPAELRRMAHLSRDGAGCPQPPARADPGNAEAVTPPATFARHLGRFRARWHRAPAARRSPSLRPRLRPRRPPMSTARSIRSTPPHRVPS